MLKPKIRRAITTGWLLENKNYQELESVEFEIKELLYEASWKGLDIKLEDRPRYIGALLTDTRIGDRWIRDNYPKLPHTCLMERHTYYYDRGRKQSYWSSKQFNYHRGHKMTDLSLEEDILLLPGTVRVGGRLGRRDLRRFYKLWRRRVSLINLLYSQLCAITDTLLHPACTLTLLRQITPDLYESFKKTK